MTVDLGAVRAALAAATPFIGGDERPRQDYLSATHHLKMNAPSWLADMATEIEELREEVESYRWAAQE
jgi:hypothetical protein